MSREIDGVDNVPSTQQYAHEPTSYPGRSKQRIFIVNTS